MQFSIILEFKFKSQLCFFRWKAMGLFMRLNKLDIILWTQHLCKFITKAKIRHNYIELYFSKSSKYIGIYIGENDDESIEK